MNWKDQFYVKIILKYLKSKPMSFPEEDERVSEMDKLWLLEKEAEIFVEWQLWMDQQERVPAKIEILTPFPKFTIDEVEFDSFSF
jgi:hypothetical protein